MSTNGNAALRQTIQLEGRQSQWLVTCPVIRDALQSDITSSSLIGQCPAYLASHWSMVSIISLWQGLDWHPSEPPSNLYITVILDTEILSQNNEPHLLSDDLINCFFLKCVHLSNWREEIRLSDYIYMTSMESWNHGNCVLKLKVVFLNCTSEFRPMSCQSGVWRQGSTGGADHWPISGLCSGHVTSTDLRGQGWDEAGTVTSDKICGESQIINKLQSPANGLMSLLLSLSRDETSGQMWTTYPHV